MVVVVVVRKSGKILCEWKPNVKSALILTFISQQCPPHGDRGQLCLLGQAFHQEADPCGLPRQVAQGGGGAQEGDLHHGHSHLHQQEGGHVLPEQEEDGEEDGEEPAAAPQSGIHGRGRHQAAAGGGGGRVPDGQPRHRRAGATSTRADVPQDDGGGQGRAEQGVQVHCNYHHMR